MKPQEKFVGFDALKRAVSMVQILDRYGFMERLRRNGDNLSGACPIHGGHNQTQFRVSLSKNCWICFGDCHAGGSIIDFVSRKEGIGIRDAALLIQDWFNVRADPAPLATQPAERAGERAVQRSSDPDRNPPLKFSLQNLDRTHPYLSLRGLAVETTRTFGLGYCRNGMLAGWIAIPIHDATGQLVAYAGRWPGEPRNGEPKYRLKGIQEITRAVQSPPRGKGGCPSAAGRGGRLLRLHEAVAVRPPTRCFADGQHSIELPGRVDRANSRSRRTSNSNVRRGRGGSQRDQGSTGAFEQTA